MNTDKTFNNKNQILGFTSKFTNFEIVNSEFTKCKCYMLATGDNVNGSDITLESVKKAMARGEFYNKPIVAHLYRDAEDNNKWRVGGHDSKWVITNTSFDMIDETIPFGVIPETSDLKLEEVLEPDGFTVNTYLTCNIILWTGRYNIMDAAYSDDIYFNQSCELSMNEYHWKDNGVLAIDDFTFSALCLLNKSSDPNKNVRPCFPSCRIEKMKAFSIDTDKFKQNFELMLDKIKQYESVSTTATVQHNVASKQKKEEGNFMVDLTKFTALLSEIKYDEVYTKYSLLGADENNIYVADKEDIKLYSVGYAEADGNIIINWNTKKEADITYTDKSENEEPSVFTNIFNDFKEDLNKRYEKDFDEKLEAKVKIISDDAESRFAEMKNNYSDLQNSYAVAKERLDKIEAAEAEKAKERHIDAAKEILERFEEKIGKTPEFIYYKAKVDYEKVDLDTLEKDLTLMTGNILMNRKNNKTFSYNPTSTNVSIGTEKQTSSRYGHLLDNYM